MECTCDFEPKVACKSRRAARSRRCDKVALLTSRPTIRSALLREQSEHPRSVIPSLLIFKAANGARAKAWR